jgi:hypothetical protein
MLEHKDYVFSATVFCNDLGVICSLRGLAFYCQTDANKQISWGNIKEKDWRRDGCKATFHFSRQNYRDNFIIKGKEVFREGLFEVISTSNDDPAKRAE